MFALCQQHCTWHGIVYTGGPQCLFSFIRTQRRTITGTEFFWRALLPPQVNGNPIHALIAVLWGKRCRKKIVLSYHWIPRSFCLVILNRKGSQLYVVASSATALRATREEKLVLQSQEKWFKNNWYRRSHPLKRGIKWINASCVFWHLLHHKWFTLTLTSMTNIISADKGPIRLISATN